MRGWEGLEDSCLISPVPVCHQAVEFHEDLFPDTAGCVPSSEPHAWWSGSNQQVGPSLPGHSWPQPLKPFWQQPHSGPHSPAVHWRSCPVFPVPTCLPLPTGAEGQPEPSPPALPQLHFMPGAPCGALP